MWKPLILLGTLAWPVGTAMAQEGVEAAVPAGSADEIAEILDVVRVSGLRPLPREDLTASFSEINSETLVIRSAPYLADQLRQVPGVAVSRSGSAGGLTQVRLRGAEANHTLVLIDGIEVSDPTTGETDFGLWAGLYPARIEVLRGEQSGLYGSDAIGGVVNVVTGDEPGAGGRIEFGSRNTWRLDGSYGVPLQGGALNFAIADVITDGVDTSGTGGENDGYQNYSAMVSGRFDLADWEASGLLRYGYGEVDTDPDLDFDGRLDDADRQTDSTQWTLGGTLGGRALGIDHLFRLSFNTVERENFAEGVSTNRSQGDRAKLSYSPSITRSVAAGEIRLSGLIDYEAEDYTARDTQFGGATNQDEGFNTLGLAGEALVDVGKLDITASVRFDGNDGRFEDTTTGRLGLAYDFGAGGRVRTSVGNGVKNPTFTELFGFFPGSFVGNSNLQPERSTSWEIGWDARFDTLDVSATYFSAALEDEIVTAFNPDFTSTVRNRDGKSKRSGVELAAGWAPSAALRLQGQVSVISSESDDGSDEIRVPGETASLSVAYSPERWSGTRFGVAVDYVGEQDDFDFGSFPARRVSLDSYILASATAEVPVNDWLLLTLRGENLFDETVTDVFGFNGPGAGVFIGLKLRP